jgi:hypothetical protein
VRVIRRTLAEVAAEAKLRDRQLFIGEQAVSVVYYRSGYAPADYPSEAVSLTHLTPHGSLSQMDTDAALPLFVSEGLAYHQTGSLQVEKNMLLKELSWIPSMSSNCGS